MPTTSGPARTLDRALLESGRAGELATHLDEVMSVGPFRGDGNPIPLRPVVLPGKQFDALPRVARRLRRLIGEVCHRRAEKPADLAAEVGWRPPPVSLWTDEPSQNRWALAVARPDFVLCDGVPQLLEYDFSSSIGGSEQLPRMDRVYWARDDIAATGNRWAMWSQDGWDQRRRFIQRVGRSIGRPRPSVAMLGWYEEAGYGSESAFADVIADLRANGVPTIYVRPEDLRVRDGVAYAGDARIDIVWRTFVTADAGMADMELGPLQEVVRRNAAVVLSPEVSELYSSKKVLAWLTEDAASGVLAPADQRFVQRHVPWTHVLHTDSPHLRSVLADRQSFIVKPYQGHSASGITVGRATDDGTWHSVITAIAAAGTHIVQRLVDADPIEVALHDPKTGDSGLFEARCVLAPLLFGDACGGILARHTPATGGDIVNTGTGTMNSTFGWE